MDGMGRHDKLRQPFTLLIPLRSVSSDVKFFSRSSWSDLSVEITDDDLEEGMIFLVELLQFHIEGFELILVVAGCWCVGDEDCQSWS